MNTIRSHLYVESKKQKYKLVDTENRLVVARGGGRRVGKMGEGGQKVQTSSYKINKSQRCNIQYGDYG